MIGRSGSCRLYCWSLTNQIPACDDIILRPGWRQVLLYKCVQRLLNRLCVLHNWSKHSACTTSLNKNAIGRSILLGSKNLREGGDLIFQFKGDLLFWHFLIRWKMSRLGHFRCFLMALIQSRRMWAGSYRFFILYSKAHCRCQFTSCIRSEPKSETKP